ncbi:hypothetical protein [Streptomyces californicus]
MKSRIREGGDTAIVVDAPVDRFAGQGESGQTAEGPTSLIELRVAG